MDSFVATGLSILKFAGACLGYGLAAFAALAVIVLVSSLFDRRPDRFARKAATAAQKAAAVSLLLIAFTGCAATVEPEAGSEEASLEAPCEGRLEGLYRVTYEVLSGTCEAPAEATWLANAEAEEPRSCHTWRTRSADGCDWYIKRECEDWDNGVRLGRSWQAGTISAVDWPARLEGTLGIEGWALDPDTGIPVPGSDCRGELAVNYVKL